MLVLKHKIKVINKDERATSMEIVLKSLLLTLGRRLSTGLYFLIKSAPFGKDMIQVDYKMNRFSRKRENHCSMFMFHSRS